MKKPLFTVLAVVLLCTAPAAAQTNGDSTDNTDSQDGILEAITGLAADLPQLVQEAIFSPFLELLKYLVTAVATVLTHTPDVYPNPAVEEIHQLALLVTYLLSGLAFMIAGLLHMVGPILGVSYQEVRMILPRVVAALVFSSVSLPLLQYMVDLTNALTHAFKPDAIGATLQEIAGVAAALGIVWVINAALFLTVLLVFIVRAAYLLFVASISPLIALAWSLPKASKYAESFIGGWFTALLIAPLDMVVLKFIFTLLSGQGATLAQSLSNWVYGMAAAVLLLFVPRQLYGASQAAIGQASSITRQAKSRWRKRKRSQRRNKRQVEWHRYRQERLRQLGGDPDYRDRDGGDER